MIFHRYAVPTLQTRTHIHLCTSVCMHTQLKYFLADFSQLCSRLAVFSGWIWSFWYFKSWTFERFKNRNKKLKQKNGNKNETALATTAVYRKWALIRGTMTHPTPYPCSLTQKVFSENKLDKEILLNSEIWLVQYCGKSHVWQLTIKLLNFLRWKSMGVHDFSIVTDRIH